MNGWRLHPLGELCDILDSLRKPITKRDRLVGPYPYYGATGIVDYTNGYLFDEQLVLIGEDGAKWLQGDQTAFIATGKYWVNNHAHVLRPHRNIILDEWLVKYLEFSDLTPFVGGMTVPKLNQGNMRQIPIPVPPLDEQMRIVAILDQAFASIAIAKANTEKNLANARELFDSFVRNVFLRIGEAAGHRRLGDIVERLTNGFVGPTRDIYVKDGVPYLLARHVRNNKLTFDGKTFVSSTFNEKNKKSKLKRGDILLVQSGHIGHTAVVGAEHEGHNCHAMIVISPIGSILSGAYLSYFFNSPEMRNSFEAIRSGSTVPHLTCGAVKELLIPITTVDEQQQLVNALDALKDETSRVSVLLLDKLVALDALKQSLLHAAFTGQLTAAEPVTA